MARAKNASGIIGKCGVWFVILVLYGAGEANPPNGKSADRFFFDYGYTFDWEQGPKNSC